MTLQIMYVLISNYATAGNTVTKSLFSLFE